MVEKDVLCSIKPQYVEKILNGSKTVELRRKFNVELINSRLFIYATSPVMAVVASANIKNIEYFDIQKIWNLYGDASGITENSYYNYFKNCELGYVIHLDNVKKLPNEILRSNLIKKGIYPPQSYRYIEWKNLKKTEHDQ